MDFGLVIATWLHTVAFVIAWGYYGILARFVLPALKETTAGPVLGTSLAAIDRRAMPFVLLTVVLFLATGSYLLVTNPSYEGLGNFGSTWATLMLIKHGLIVVLIAVGVTVHFMIDGVELAADDAARRAGARRLGLAAEIATVLGAVIVLLTAAAQATV
jgi:uncharacterized membrane protein